MCEALVAARAGDEERLRQIMVTGNQPAGAAAAQNVPYSVSLMPGMTEADLADPGPSVSLCFDYVNNSACTRLRNGQTCKYRHLPQTHPDVIKDKLRQGKLTPQIAAQLLTSAGHADAIPAVVGSAAAVAVAMSAASAALGVGATTDVSLSSGLSASLPPTLQATPTSSSNPTPAAPSDPMAAAALMGASAGGAAMMPGLPPDPGPGAQLCFDFINRGMCSRLQRGESCRYRHLPPTHPDVIADRIRNGKSPGMMPNQPMGNYVSILAQQGATMHGLGAAGAMPMPTMSAMMAVNGNALMMGGAQSAALSNGGARREGSPRSDDNGERFRARDREREERRRRDSDRRDGYHERRDYDDYYRRRDRRGHDDERRECEPSHKPAIARPAAPGDLSATSPSPFARPLTLPPHPAPGATMTGATTTVGATTIGVESAIRTTDGTTIDGITIGDRTSDAIVSTTGVAPSRPIGGARTIAVPTTTRRATAAGHRRPQPRRRHSRRPPGSDSESRAGGVHQ